MLSCILQLILSTKRNNNDNSNTYTETESPGIIVNLKQIYRKTKPMFYKHKLKMEDN